MLTRISIGSSPCQGGGWEGVSYVEQNLDQPLPLPRGRLGGVSYDEQNLDRLLPLLRGRLGGGLENHAIIGE